MATPNNNQIYSGFGATFITNLDQQLVVSPFAMLVRAISGSYGKRTRISSVSAAASPLGPYPAAAIPLYHLFILKIRQISAGSLQPDAPNFGGYIFIQGGNEWFTQAILQGYTLEWKQLVNPLNGQPQSFVVDVEANDDETLLVCQTPMFDFAPAIPANITTQAILTVNGYAYAVPKDTAQFKALPRFDVADDNHFTIPVR